MALSTWNDFKLAFGKSYSSVEEEASRMKIFEQNLKLIQKKNSVSRSATYGVTKFTDMTSAEFKSKLLNYHRRQFVSAELYQNDAAIASVDWRTKNKNVITPVKDQGQCGSCWAFSAVEETESMWVLAGESQKIFAPQQVVSCDTTDLGCNGGDTPTAYAYIKSAKGLETEKDYPYTSGSSGDDGTCTYQSNKIAGGNNNGFKYASTPCTSAQCNEVNETALLTSLQAAPISLCVYAEPWQFYTSGIMTADECDGALADLDHCVQLVGYKDAAAQSYYIVRNSWNTDWGIDGYIWLSVGENTCGVADEATIPTIAN